MEKYVFYIGDFKAGLMDAQCQLVLGNSNLLKEVGYKVILIGNDASLSNENDILSSKRNIEGFDFYNIKFSKNIKGLLEFSKVHENIKKVLNAYPNPEFIILYGSPAFAIEIHKLYRWCKKSGVKLISNCVDLSSQAHGTLAQRIIKTIDRYYKEKIICYKSDGIIAVSSYIANHFKKYNSCPIVILPPLKDTKSIGKPNLSNNETKKIVYIGVPFPIDGRAVDEAAYKDRIDLFIDILCRIRNEVLSFQFDIYGLTEEQYLNVINRHKELIKKNRDIIKFHGRVEHQKVVKAVSEADYSVLFRVANEMTMAGFSSKLVESISTGTPMLLTDTSDYLNILQEGVSCIVIDQEVSGKACQAVKNALLIERDILNEMKMECYNSRVFDYRNYKVIFEKFLKKLNN